MVIGLLLFFDDKAQPVAFKAVGTHFVFKPQPFGTSPPGKYRNDSTASLSTAFFLLDVRVDISTSAPLRPHSLRQ